MEKGEIKKRVALRLYDPHKKLIEQEFGSLQKGVDFFIEMLEKYGRKNFLKHVREKVERY